jgi:hypothetical protein
MDVDLHVSSATRRCSNRLMVHRTRDPGHMTGNAGAMRPRCQIPINVAKRSISTKRFDRFEFLA